MQMGKEVREDGGYASSILLFCRPQPGIVVDVTLSARFGALSACSCIIHACISKTAVEAAVEAFHVVYGSWPYVIVI